MRRRLRRRAVGKGRKRSGGTLTGPGHFGGDPGRLWPPPKWPGLRGKRGCGSCAGLDGECAGDVRNSTSLHETSHPSHWSALCRGEKLSLCDGKAPQARPGPRTRHLECDGSVTSAASASSLPETCRPCASFPRKPRVPGVSEAATACPGRLRNARAHPSPTGPARTLSRSVRPLWGIHKGPPGRPVARVPCA